MITRDTGEWRDEYGWELKFLGRYSRDFVINFVFWLPELIVSLQLYCETLQTSWTLPNCLNKGYLPLVIGLDANIVEILWYLA